MLYKLEKTEAAYSYTINGNMIRCFILLMLLLLGGIYFFATLGQETLSLAAFYLAVALSAFYFLNFIPIWWRMLIAAHKGKTVKRTSEVKGAGWGKNNFNWHIEIER